MEAEGIMWLALTLGTAAVTGLVAMRAKVPTGGMVGAMIGVALLNIFTGVCAIPDWLRNAMQVMSGIMIGSRITRRDIIALRRVAVPALIMVPCLLTINVLIGVLLRWVGGLDAPTALFSCAPGGVAEMALVAQDLGADTGKVSILQLVRLFGVISIFPAVFKRLKPVEKATGQTEQEAVADSAGNARIKNIALTIAVAVTGGFLGWLIKLPAGPMIGSMVFTAMASVATGRMTCPRQTRLPVQIVAGAYIGSRMTMSTALAIGSLALPALVLLASLFLNTFGLGIIMHKLSGVDSRTCFLASTPGGVTEMSLLADDLGADAAAVSVLQTVRLFSVILLFPLMLRLAIPLLEFLP